MKPYGLAADLHLHAWKAFGSSDEKGVSTRLSILLSELGRLWDETHKAGGDRVVIAGDLFHVRGTIAPSVLNPVRGTFRALRKKYPGIAVDILAGNHDMEFRHSSDVGNAVQAVDLEGVTIVNEPISRGDLHFIPWFEDLADVKGWIEAVSVGDRAGLDLIIHAPIDGVIPGIPDHGLTADYLGGLGFRRVFAGHYHQHKDFENGVYSIGAIAHHTWSDVGTKAGFLIVTDTEVRRVKSAAPEFMDLNATDDPDEVELRVPGNYVRVKTSSTKTKELNELREWLTKAGAREVLIQHVPEATATRAPGAAITAAVASTLEASVAGFVQGSGLFTERERIEKVNKQCQVILAEANVI